MSIENNQTETTRPNLATAWNEANLIRSAIDKGDIPVSEHRDTEHPENYYAVFPDKELDPNNVNYEDLIPHIIHTEMFVELSKERRENEEKEGEALLNLLHQSKDGENEVIDLLQENKVSLAIAMQGKFEEDKDLLKGIKELQERGINTTLWLVLDDKVGYWSNKSNVEETVTKLQKLLDWAKDNNLFSSENRVKIGLDYEPDIELSKVLQNGPITKLPKELSKYMRDVEENRKKYGNIQKYMDAKLKKFMKDYGVSIETYIPAQPLRTLARMFNLILKPNKDTDHVPMAYTSIVRKDYVIKEEGKDNNKKIILKEPPFDSLTKKKMDLVLALLKEGQIPASGIIGRDPMNTPGRDLRETGSGEKKPEKHLSAEELTYVLNNLFTRSNPFREHKVFALDHIDTLLTLLKARRNATKED